jgi:hypothetical protein
MPTKYLLPCSCGAKIPVEKSQAGQSVTCACGSALAVPTFREISRLEPMEQAAAEPARGWSPLQGMVFAAGLVMAAGGLLAAAFFGVQRAQLPTLDPATMNFDSERFAQYLDEATPLEIYEDHWKNIEEQGLGPWQPPPHVMLREISALLLNRVFYSLIAAIVGAFLVASSFFLGSRRPA